MYALSLYVTNLVGDTSKWLKCYSNSVSVTVSSSHMMTLSILNLAFPQCSRLHHAILSSGTFFDNISTYSSLGIYHHFIHLCILSLLSTCSFIHSFIPLKQRLHVKTIAKQAHFKVTWMCHEKVWWWPQKLAPEPVHHIGDLFPKTHVSRALWNK